MPFELLAALADVLADAATDIGSAVGDALNDAFSSGSGSDAASAAPANVAPVHFGDSSAWGSGANEGFRIPDTGYRIDGKVIASDGLNYIVPGEGPISINDPRVYKP